MGKRYLARPVEHDRTLARCRLLLLLAFTSTQQEAQKMREIDIIEGAHDNEHNQVACHTSPGCILDAKEQFSGNISMR